MVYEPLYHALEIAGIKLSSVVLSKRNQKNLAIFLDFFLNETIIPLTLVGFEIIMANSALRAETRKLFLILIRNVCILEVKLSGTVGVIIKRSAKIVCRS